MTRRLAPCLERLNPFRHRDIEAALREREPMPAHVLVGAIGRVAFVATQDHDGQIEVSVSLPAARAEARHVAAICRHMGINPPARATRIEGGGLMWVAQEGVVH